MSLDDPSVGLDDPSVGLDEPLVGLDEPLVGLDEPLVGPDDLSVSLDERVVGKPTGRMGFQLAVLLPPVAPSNRSGRLLSNSLAT